MSFIDARIQDYLVLDVETGGLLTKKQKSEGKCEVVDVALTEIALVYVNADLEIVDKYSALIKPYYEGAEYQTDAAAISGITKEDCEIGGKEICQVVDDIIEFIEFNNKKPSIKPVMVGHNLRAFDSYWIENLFSWCGDDVYKHTQTLLIDTLEESWKLFPQAPDFKLGTMCGQFDIELSNAHRALPDTIANAELWISMLNRLRNESTGATDTVIEHERLRNTEDFSF